MGSVGLKMLAVKATNNSQQIVKSMHEISSGPKMSSNQGSKNVSGDLQEKNTTSKNISYDWGMSTNQGSKNVSHDLQEKNSTSENHYDWGVSSKG